MIEYLLILSEHEGIAIRAAHLPRPGDTLDVLKDYGARERLRFIVETVQYDVIVEDVPKDGVRGTCETLPFVQGKIVERKIDGVWQPTARLCKHGSTHNLKRQTSDGVWRDGFECDGCCKHPGAHPERWPAAK